MSASVCQTPATDSLDSVKTCFSLVCLFLRFGFNEPDRHQLTCPMAPPYALSAFPKTTWEYKKIEKNLGIKVGVQNPWFSDRRSYKFFFQYTKKN